MINIKVNNTAHQFEHNCSLKTILSELNIVVSGIAVAVNQNIITKSDWNNTILNNNDEVLIIKATQGG
jgi:sulfur carrier protein